MRSYGTIAFSLEEKFVDTGREHDIVSVAGLFSFLVVVGQSMTLT